MDSNRRTAATPQAQTPLDIRRSCVLSFATRGRTRHRARPLLFCPPAASQTLHIEPEGATPIILLLNSDQSEPKSPPAGGVVYRRFADDPVEFVRRVLCEAPYHKQEQMLRAVAASRRSSVVGCNASGKDWAAARCVLWWMHSREPAKAIVTGPTTRQVDDIVWNEMRFAHARAADRLGARMFRTSRYEVDDHSFALGFASNSPFNLQGFHSPNLLVVVTEAHAVRDRDFDALRRLNPGRMLMTGNPFVTSGPFFDSHHSREDLYATVQISAFDTPNLTEGDGTIEGLVTAQDIEDRKAEWGEDNPLYVGGVLGRFPDNLENFVVPCGPPAPRADATPRRKARWWSPATWPASARTAPWL